MHLVAFTVEMYCDARSYKRQTPLYYVQYSRYNLRAFCFVICLLKPTQFLHLVCAVRGTLRTPSVDDSVLNLYFLWDTVSWFCGVGPDGCAYCLSSVSLVMMPPVNVMSPWTIITVFYVTCWWNISSPEISMYLGCYVSIFKPLLTNLFLL